MDYLEQLAGEWYEYQGYFVRRDLWVGLESDGSYECELDVVGFHPIKHHLVQVEPLMNCLDWKQREQHLRLKFDAGRKYLHRMFGAAPHLAIEQIALVAVAADPHRRSVAGGKIVLLSEFLSQILAKLATVSVSADLVPEQWPLLRTLQFVAEYRQDIAPILLETSRASRPGSGGWYSGK
ncbi:MAG: hypothetical protein A2150_06495 [Candidatus Muproteobacteria bacterium RBG_16_64_11]|uniref:Uncharacterized protein n=1 Tax=Candidatus Muproteobacteria bacterium RBG_16_64_11 TaxID=1817758 RepID=A0A1F6TD45_9PROT|nr:MAG: hypothetical protein A2150_06495 [Candidatus Muproteobacteria bacterium RBG_16_64_11]